MGYLLNLKPARSVAQDHWTDTTVFHPNMINSIEDNQSDKVERPIASIPSPFAQMHLFDYAFRSVNGRGEMSGNSLYHRLISYTFDVMELLFHANNIGGVGGKLEVKEWVFNHQIDGLITSRSDGHRILGETLKLFIEQDRDSANFGSFDRFYLIAYNHRVFAATSPLTMFFTVPHHATLKTIDIRRTNGTRYFETTLALHERDRDFQMFVHRLIAGHREFSGIYRSVHDYVDKNRPWIKDRELRIAVDAIYANGFSEHDFRSEYTEPKNLKLYLHQVGWRCARDLTNRISERSGFLMDVTKPTDGLIPMVLSKQFTDPGVIYVDADWNEEVRRQVPVTDPNPLESRTLPGTQIPYPYLLASDLLENSLIKLPYKAHPSFLTLTHSDEDESYMLPVKLFYYNYFSPEDLRKQISFTVDGDAVTVRLQIPTRSGKRVELKRRYVPDPIEGTDTGRIVEWKFDVAVFPFYRVKQEAESVERYNVMMVDGQRNRKDFPDLTFFDSRMEPLSESKSKQSPVKKIVRHDKKVFDGGVYYQITGAQFDYIRCELKGPQKAVGWIVPMWRYVEPGTRAYTFAVDFGTTSTHIAYADATGAPKPFDFTKEDMPVVNLYGPEKISNRDAVTDLYRRYNDRTVLPQSSVYQENDFVPTFIGAAGSPIQFPIRTATSESPGFVREETFTLGNINMAFNHERHVEFDDEIVHTNIKWKINLDEKTTERIRAFFEEILLLIRHKVVLNQGDPAKTKLIWFHPLSMSAHAIGLLKSDWTQLAQKVLGISEQAVIEMTESQAPYYYHKATTAVVGDSNVLCVDIGGGSTDIVVFEKRQPKFGSSFNFGCNVLWSEGNVLASRVNNKDNGIFREAYQAVFRNAPPNNKEWNQLRDICEQYLANERKRSEDVMQVFFKHEHLTQISERLGKDQKFKIIFLAYYAATVYHALQCMRTKKLQAPHYICFSGNGSRVLGFIDRDPALKNLTAFTRILAEAVYGNGAKEMRLVVSKEPKQATCIGGIVRQKENEQPIEAMIHLGGKKKNDAKGLTYDAVSDGVKKDVQDNIKDFINLFFDLNEQISFHEYFGIEADLAMCRTELQKDIIHLISDGISHQVLLDGTMENHPVKETLFFYPLVHAFYNLSKVL
ncbi:MAG TPA: hypothetical protein PKV06_03285 [bacterium]|nr:hypothetical protein [bacterium]HMW32860.1 hypothetical protein [bacterium]HMW34753.1 hypothetical protein [bacterium]HMZ03545.1 hypothetical protein [bacterium]HNB55969.1 hypothetical protein [bacterium]